MKIVFAGTPDLAVPCLQALLHSEHEVCAVYTQPDRPAGRGQKLQQSPVKQLALANHIPVLQPESFKSDADFSTLKNYQADLMVVIAYGLLLPERVLNIFPLGCVNPHVSLLPKWRGAAPIERAIEAGDTKTGVTLIQMDTGWDTGDMLAQQSIPIHNQDTSQHIHDQLATVAAELLIQTLPKIKKNSLAPQKQDHRISTHAKKLSKAEAKINWHMNATVLHNKIRAFNPWPVCFCDFNDDVLRIWSTEVIDDTSNALPGTIINASKLGIDVACHEGILRLLEIQLPGSKRLSASDFFNARGKQLVGLQLK